MRIKCNYCGGYLEDTDVNCPNCNAPNEHLKRSADGIPKTIEEFKIFAAKKGIPLSQMRFFIGYDMREPRAYGIYKDEEAILLFIRINQMVKELFAIKVRMKLMLSMRSIRS